MRSAIAIAAFAAGTVAVPFAEKRGLMATAYNVVYVTDVVTVTVDGAEPKKTPEAKHYGHKNNHPVVQPYAEQPKPAPTPAAYIPVQYEAPSRSSAAPVTNTGGVDLPDLGDDYKNQCLYHHNIHRANHSVPALTWSESLADIARQIGSSCRYEHDTTTGGGGYGQNIAAGVSSENVSAIITDMFYNGEEPLFTANYGLDSPDMSNFMGWGHFTQMVWKSTTEVGCYTYDCSSRGLANTGGGVSPHFTVCNYKTPGNYANQYASNVLQPKGQASADWSSGLKAYSKAKKN